MYQLLQCSLESSRGRVDWRNAAIAGYLSGACAGIPLAIRAKEPALVVVLAGLVAAVTTSLEFMKKR